MRWLISYRSQEHVRTARGTFIEAPGDAMHLFERHPAEIAADAAIKLRALYASEGLPEGETVQTAGEILCIYSVVEIPDGMLSRDALLALRSWLPTDREP